MLQSEIFASKNVEMLNKKYKEKKKRKIEHSEKRPSAKIFASSFGLLQQHF